jgi:hypothetical protein
VLPHKVALDGRKSASWNHSITDYLKLMKATVATALSSSKDDTVAAEFAANGDLSAIFLRSPIRLVQSLDRLQQSLLINIARTET